MNHAIPWSHEYSCPACGARVMRMFDSPRGRLVDNDPASRMGEHVCPAEEQERMVWWAEWAKSDQSTAMLPVASETRQDARSAPQGVEMGIETPVLQREPW